MPACWGIMAGVCLRYKGTELSHEVILISYALIQCPACQTQRGRQQPLPALAELPGRAHRPLGPWSPLQHCPASALACCPHSSPISKVTPMGAVSISSWYWSGRCRDGDEGLWVSPHPWDYRAVLFLSSCLSGKYLFCLPGSIRRCLNSLHIPCPICPEPLCASALLPISSVSAGQLLSQVS